MDEEIDSGVVVLHHDRGELKMHDSRLRALDSTARDPERRLRAVVPDPVVVTDPDRPEQPLGGRPGARRPGG